MKPNIDNIKTVKYMKDMYGNKSSVRVTLHNPPQVLDSEPFTEMFVPVAEENSNYQDILAWVEAGNTIEEAD